MFIVPVRNVNPVARTSAVLAGVMFGPTPISAPSRVRKGNRLALAFEATGECIELKRPKGVLHAYAVGSHVAALAKGALQPQESFAPSCALQARGLYNPVLFTLAYDWMNARGLTDGGSEHAVFVSG